MQKIGLRASLQAIHDWEPASGLLSLLVTCPNFDHPNFDHLSHSPPYNVAITNV